ncbi:hypothetical protein [Phocaeicola dorei]|uniref:hypothetical protein n=1 Tax=Phocaeicola dorei TaxID=357276 RepID=UPI002E779881|nr:hypothetical protein [Phocaeicola dorei]
MAIKALKQNVSISETQKMIHQWKGRGINDPTITKLLDLYLGMPAYMNSQGIYPHCNFYDIRLSLRFSYTSTLVTAVTNCRSFGMIWDEPHTKVIAFYSPLWYRQENGNPTESPQKPAQETPQDSAFNSNILYNINNIYPPEDSRKGYSAGNGVRNTEETDSRKTPSEIPAETPDGGKTSPAPSSATDFFHRLNATPKDKKQVLVPIINNIATSHHYTRPRALQGLVILVNQFLIPYFDSDPRFSRISHTGRIIWLQNLMKTRHGQSLMGQAIARLGSELNKDLEEKHRKLREFRPVSPFEWKESDKNIRYYDDPIDGKVEIPENAPPRPAETAIWNVLSKEWVDND